MTRPTRTNIEYGSEHARQRFDLYPVEDDAAPLIIWIHGGGFRQGSKDNIPPQILAFQERGFAIASIEYRLSNVPWPATLTDPKRALLWIRRHADELGVDPDRIAVSGESAGGCLAALLGASAGAEGLRDDPSLADEDRPVSLAISLFGPTQFEVMNEDGLAAGCTPGFDHLAPDSPENELLDCPSGDLRDCPDRLTFSNPVAYVDAEDPPFVFLHGGADCTVAAGQSERMHHALTEAGVSSVLHVVPGAAHRVDPILANSDAAQSLEDALFVHVAGCTPPDNGPGGGG